MKNLLDQTLEELDGEDWGEPPYPSHLVIECHRLRRVPLKDFTVDDLRRIIGQKFSLEYLVPLALAEIESDPLVGDLYEGDLLESVSQVPVEFWEQYADLRERWQEILIMVANLPADVLDDLSPHFLAKLIL